MNDFDNIRRTGGFDPGRKAPERRSRGAILIFTLVMIVVTSTALFFFIEKAIYEIRSEALHAERDRLRPQAHSILDAVVAVLVDIRQIDGGLYDPAQGWSDPLEYAGIRVPDGVQVEVDFRDESGKLSLPTMDRERLVRLFDDLGVESGQVEDLADALLAWMDESYDQSRFGGGWGDYSRAEIPYRPSYESLQSFHELLAIEGFREIFFDEIGNPTSLFYRFAQRVSLRNFDRVNINSAPTDVMAIWGGMDDSERSSLTDVTDPANRGDRGYFENLGEAGVLLGADFSGARFDTRIRYLRVNVRVSDGASHHRVSAVFDVEGGGAGAPAGDGQQQPPPPSGAQPEPGGGGAAGIVPETQVGFARGGGRQQNARGGDGGGQNYPFAILELRENASILY